MRISFNPQISTNYAYNKVSKAKTNNTNLTNIEETKKLDAINIQNLGNITKISFRGNFVDPNAPSIQFKVRGVSWHQKEFGSKSEDYFDRNVERLANSDWYDGQKLNWEVTENKQHERKIILKDPKYGEIGRVPDDVAPSFLKLFNKSKNPSRDFTFQLSNVIAGTTKGAATIGLRANLLYTGDDPKIKAETEKVFNDLLNSKNKDITDVIMLYQPVTTPKQVLQKIFSNVEETQGEDAAFKVLDIIDAVSEELNNPKNKNILLLGHTAPDGDTIGCVLGLQAAIKANYPSKNVVCSIDDKIPGIYRDKLPGIHNITQPSDPDLLENLRQELTKWEAKPKSFVSRNQIRTIKKELDALEKSAKMLGNSGKKEEVPTQYDLVVLMDVPSPSKFTGSYKKEIESAGKVIYIDHHRPRFEEWDAHSVRTGIDMQKVRKDNLALVLPELPATTELVTVLTDNAGLLDETIKNRDWSKQFVAGIVSGTSSDTGGFSRTANYKPTDMFKPVQERPNYYPEGLAKWLIDQISNVVDKKWLRENIVYDLPDKKISGVSQTAREKMIDYCLQYQSIYPKNGFGVISMSYDEMYDVWELARLTDRKVTFGDVQNAAKYSEVMSALREAPSRKTENSEIEPYKSPYQDDKISLLLLQDKKEGRPDATGEIATENSIRMSFRSQDGTVYAEQLATLFGGGGHGSAAGGRITLKGVELTSPIAIKIDGEVEYDPAKIYKAMTENYAVKNDTELEEADVVSKLHKFETVIDENGKSINDLVNSIVEEIRDNEKQAKLSNVKKS